MFPNEASWFYDKILQINPGEVFPMLNLGSSTGYYRTIIQPYIDNLLFKPLREQGRKVIHCDIKEAEGVDIIGDLSSTAFVEKLQCFEFRSVICSHLLEHVENPASVASSIMQIIPADGYLFVSCPYRYPHHPDPVDTMFRPSPEKLSSYFPGMKIIDSCVISGGRYGKFGKSAKSIVRELMRLAIPFYKPTRWLWHFREAKGTCLVLKKDS
jgi:hypothetical protein